MSLNICKVYLIRHATPDWSRKDLVYHLPPGPPLTEEGLAEAKALGGFLQQAGIRRLFASPLERCEHTARIAGEIAGVKLEVLPDLAEWRPGEVPATVRTRFWPLLEDAWRLAAVEGPVGLVTHGGPISVLLEELGADPQELNRLKSKFDHRNPLPPAGAWEVHCNGAGEGWKLRLAFTPNGDRA